VSVDRLWNTDERTNGIIGWGLLGVVLLSAAQSFLAARYLWGGFELLFVVVAALPVLFSRDWRVLVRGRSCSSAPSRWGPSRSASTRS